MLSRTAHDESGGEIVHNKTDGETYRTFGGMSSEVAMEKIFGRRREVPRQRRQSGHARSAWPGRSHGAGSAGRAAVDLYVCGCSDAKGVVEVRYVCAGYAAD